jgi:hypothetical protein
MFLLNNFESSPVKKLPIPIKKRTDWKFISDLDDHPEHFNVDPQPIPESVSVAKCDNIKNQFNRSHMEAVAVGVGSITLVAMAFKYSTK